MNTKPEENVLNSSVRAKKLELTIKTTIEAFRLARARGQFPNSGIVEDGIIDAALKISINLETKMTSMKISWIACISLYFALKEDMNITDQFTVHCGLKPWNFLQLAKRCKEALLAPSCGQTAPGTKSPMEDTWTAVTPVTATPVRTIPRHGGVPQEASGQPLQVYAGDVIVNGKIKRRRSGHRVVYQVRY